MSSISFSWKASVPIISEGIWLGVTAIATETGPADSQHTVVIIDLKPINRLRKM